MYPLLILLIQFAKKHKLNVKHVRQIEDLFSPLLSISEISEKEAQDALNLLEPFDCLLPEEIVPKKYWKNNNNQISIFWKAY
jgi:hypothetical protein